jgi:hypothetical protein
MHIVLVGDTIFDNASYTRGGPDVVSQVLGAFARRLASITSGCRRGDERGSLLNCSGYRPLLPTSCSAREE